MFGFYTLLICGKQRPDIKGVADESRLVTKEISKIMEGSIPNGRKFTLNFAVADYEVDHKILLKYFNPDHYIIKLTPMHKTNSAINNNIYTKGDYTSFYPYEEYEKDLIQAGYEVLVFIASHEEDAGRITCGNAILSGSMPFCEYKEINAT